jgi:NADH-quinone oxidoreductase subunit L
MVLGIGTALPVGIIGSLFHMLNDAIYKSCLFMTAGNIEKQTGTTDLRKIGGLAKSMPFTMTCFTISGFAIAGVPPFNGFFSKELIFDAALESHIAFYIAALLGAFLTAVSFLKMGRAAFAGKLRLLPDKNTVSEPGIGMVLPMGAMAALCAVFGIVNALPLDYFLGPALKYEEVFSGWPKSAALVIISFIVLILALCDHIYGSKKTGSAINAADHIHFAPVLKSVYGAAEKQWFDPYNCLMHAADGFSAICVMIERGVSWLYDVAAVKIVNGAGNFLHRIDDGSLSRYLAAAVTGVAVIVIIFCMVLL